MLRRHGLSRRVTRLSLVAGYAARPEPGRPPEPERHIEVDHPGELVGFENHSGLTYLGDDARPMGNVRIGRGNNGQDGTEGAIYRNAVGCYLHGSLLPKNPALTDWLIGSAMERRGLELPLAPLDDQFEAAAHAAAVERAVKTR